MPVGSRSALVSDRVQEEVLHQTLIEVQSRLRRNCRGNGFLCDVETMLCPRAVPFNTPGYGPQVVPGSGEGQNLTNIAVTPLLVSDRNI